MNDSIIKRMRAYLLARYGMKIDKILAEKKSKLFSNIQGTVVEIGPGTGNNLRYMPSDIEWIGIEPNQYMHKHLYATMKEVGVNGKIITEYAENIPIETNTVDVVISTLVLCSVADPKSALREIHRILKQGGQFLFIEHVAAHRKTWLRNIQRIVRPVWQMIGDGCCPDREIDTLIEQAGFDTSIISDFVEKDAFLLTPRHIAGRANKSEYNLKSINNKEIFQHNLREMCGIV